MHLTCSISCAFSNQIWFWSNSYFYVGLVIHFLSQKFYIEVLLSQSPPADSFSKMFLINTFLINLALFTEMVCMTILLFVWGKNWSCFHSLHWFSWHSLGLHSNTAWIHLEFDCSQQEIVSLNRWTNEFCFSGDSHAPLATFSETWGSCHPVKKQIEWWSILKFRSQSC